MAYRSLITLFCLFLSTQVLSRPPHERSTIQEEAIDMNQYGKIRPTSLNQLDMQISQTREFFESEQINLLEPTSETERKIKAALILQIELGLNDIFALRSELEDMSDPLEQDLELIKLRLKGIHLTIEDLNS